MTMNRITFSLLVFATVFLFSSAVPWTERSDRHKGLMDSNEWNRETLKGIKPPTTAPGPKLKGQEQIATFFPGVYLHEDKPKKQLTEKEKEKDKERKKDFSSLIFNSHEDKPKKQLTDKEKEKEKDKERKKDFSSLVFNSHEDKPKKHLTDKDKERERKKDLSPLEKNKHKDMNLMHSDKHESEQKEEENQQQNFDSV